MCTNFALHKSPGATALAERLGVDPASLRYGPDFGPGSHISIITGREPRQAQEAIWWLFLAQTDKGLRPHKKYFSVNTRYDKLPKRPEYKRSRCIVPATAFVESQDGKRPHLLEPADGRAIAFGGLWKEWVDKSTGEVVRSASIITLPGHPALADIHRKSVPLWLPDDAWDMWLDPELTDTKALDYLLEPRLVTDLKATPIDRARSKIAIGEPYLVR